MPENDFLKRQKTAATREFRLQAGHDPEAVRWQEALELMLIRVGDRLVSGRLESFDGLGGDEAKVLKALAKKVIVPDGVCIIYIPPSIIEAMVADGRLPQPAGAAAGGSSDAGKDIGILIGARCEDFDTILYAQFGLPPHSPGTEIYRDGEALAVYQYTSIEHCISELNDIIETYLGPAAVS
ncbi:MAG: hypothetical protein ABIL58_18045 [Pseudomonadota bacterium]